MTTPFESNAPSVRSVRPSTALLELVRAALPHAERSRPLLLSDRLSDLGICSLNILSLVMDLEDRYDLAPEKLVMINSRTTLADLVQLCAQEHLDPPPVQ